GLARFAGVYLALNHENDGTLSYARTTWAYAPRGPTFEPDAGSGVKVLDKNTFELTTHVKKSFSSVISFVFFDDDTATLSSVHTSIPNKRILNSFVGTLTRLTEDEFLAGIAEYNNKFNVPQNIQVQATNLSDEVQGLEGTFPTEEEWCGGLVNDTSCTTSPYQEPSPKMKEGWIALFVIIGGVFFGAVAFFLHRKAANDQKRRYKEHFVRGIARNITISETAGMVSPEELKKEFDHIDADGGGTISKDELKMFVSSGKVDEISDKDFEALWCAIDIDNSGEVDFVEFLSFLGSCGAEFEAVSQKQRAMTKEEKLLLHPKDFQLGFCKRKWTRRPGTMLRRQEKYLKRGGTVHYEVDTREYCP
ncbi:hypothetical protein ACHAWF_018054, partial [Thalassiosira exigua]